MQKYYNTLQYYILFNTRQQNTILYDEMHPEIISHIHGYFSTIKVDVLSIKIITNNRIELQIQTSNTNLNPNNLVTNIKKYLAFELFKKYPHVRLKTPGTWSREFLIQTMGQVDQEKINYFLKTVDPPKISVKAIKKSKPQ